MEVSQAFLGQVLNIIKELDAVAVGEGMEVTGIEDVIVKLEAMICGECDGSGMIPHTDGTSGYKVCQNKACQGHQRVQAYWKGVAANPPGL